MDVVAEATAWIFVGIFGLLFVLFILYLRFRTRLYAKIIMGSGIVHTEDITGKVEHFTVSRVRYLIDLSKVVRVHRIVPKNALYFLENCSKPIWFTGTKVLPGESSLRLSGFELNNVLRANLSELLKTGPGWKMRWPGFKWVVLIIVAVIAIAALLMLPSISTSPVTPENWPVT